MMEGGYLDNGWALPAYNTPPSYDTFGRDTSKQGYVYKPIASDPNWAFDEGSFNPGRMEAEFQNKLFQLKYPGAMQLTPEFAKWVIDPSRIKTDPTYGSYFTKGDLNMPLKGSDWIDKLGSAAFGVVGTMIGGPALGGAMAGFTNASQSGGNPLTGAAKGGAMGWAGGEIASGISDAAGYQPGAADAIWSESASPMSSWAAQTGIKAGTNYLTGAAKSGIAGLAGDLWGNNSSKPSTSTSNGNLFGNSGGNMADNSVSSWANALSPFLSAYNTNNQAGNTADTYGKAYDLITTPSPDQQNYRTQLSALMANPGSMESSPVYKAMSEAGMNNVNRTAAAKGMLGSGNRLAELMKVGQDTASKYYFPQQQALAQLSGVTGDSATRALGADSLLGAQSAENKQQTKMLSDLMSGFGVKSPEQQLLDAYLKRFGGNGGGSMSGVNTIVNGVKNGYDWLTGGNNSALTQSGSTMDTQQLMDLLNQQDGFNWSGMDGVIGGSQQDQMLYDQMPADWFN